MQTSTWSLSSKVKTKHKHKKTQTKLNPQQKLRPRPKAQPKPKLQRKQKKIKTQDILFKSTDCASSAVSHGQTLYSLSTLRDYQERKAWVELRR